LVEETLLVEYGTIKAKLLDSRNRRHCKEPYCPPYEPGVYGLFVHDGRDHAFAELGVAPCEHRLLYIGAATNALAARYHPTERSSRTSSPRRSFGALLREKPRCKIRPKAAGAGTHWEFAPSSEDLLSCWMKENLAYAGVQRPQECVRRVEQQLIEDLAPPLNVQHVGRAKRNRLLEARNRCKRLALDGAVGEPTSRRVEFSLPLDMAERLDEMAANRKSNVQELVVAAVRCLLDLEPSLLDLEG
jgi:hypothetical protein